MKDFDHHKKEEKYKKGGHRGKGQHHGAQTFRRGRALDFLEKLKVKQATLKQQRDNPDFQDIKQVILGELKAIEMIINEYINQFELHEVDNRDTKAVDMKEKDEDNEVE